MCDYVVMASTKVSGNCLSPVARKRLMVVTCLAMDMLSYMPSQALPPPHYASPLGPRRYEPDNNEPPSQQNNYQQFDLMKQVIKEW